MRAGSLSFVMTLALGVGLGACTAKVTPGCSEDPSKCADSTGSPIESTDDHVTPAPVAPVCEAGISVRDLEALDASDISRYAAAETGSPAVHVVGIYESSGSAHVKVERPGRHIVVLSAFEPTEWTVTAGPDARIERVIVNGFHEQKAVAPPGALVENHSGNGKYLAVCARAWRSNEGGCDTAALVKGVERATGRSITTFTGVYRATNVDVSAKCQ